MTINELVTEEIEKVLHKFNINMDTTQKDRIVYLAYKDLESFAKRDPSSEHDMVYILHSYKSYRAVLIHRIAHYIYQQGNKILARQLSEHAKLISGIEIHPAAKIGECFVLDHGLGTVIGETSIIGNRCYILQNVVLGSSQISNNADGQRHPIIGNDVEIGSFVRIYGCVTIGNSVKISPGAIIKNDIPEDSRIIVASNYQIMQGQDGIYYTGYSNKKNRITLFFEGKSLLEFDDIRICIKNKLCDISRINIHSIEIRDVQVIHIKNIRINSNSNVLIIDLIVKGIKQCISQ